jgi:8-amino-7-oxononanoate synthase
MSYPPPLPPETNTPTTDTDHFLDELTNELAHLEPDGLLRRLRLISSAGPIVTTDDGRQLLNFTSNSYLGLNEHPAMKAAAVSAVNDLGTGAGASLLISGRLPIHAQAEHAFAKFKHAQAALLMPTGYTANLAALTALAGPGDLICLDKLCHASLIDAARASGAEVRTYPHLKTNKLQRLLQRHNSANASTHACDLAPPLSDQSSIINHQSQITLPPRRFIVTDSVFSMDGDTADLPALCDLAEQYNAVTIIDEAHGTGLLGDTGAGLSEAQGVIDRIHVTISTASKALGGLGGIITAAQPIIDTIINHARSLIYTTAIPPAQAAAIEQAVKLIQTQPELRNHVRNLTIRLRHGLKSQGWKLIHQGDFIIPIVPLIVGEAHDTIALSEHLYHHGILAAPIRPPTVAPGSSRVRLSLRADMTDEHIDQVIQAASNFSH